MSLITSKEKLKDKILVGKVPSKKEKEKDTLIYFDPDNVNGPLEMKFDQDIDTYPYIDIKNKQRAAIYVSSCSGAGKSTLAANLIKKIREVRHDKKRKVVVFTSNSATDPAFEDIKNLVVVNFDHPEFPLITSDMLEDNICVFDDFQGSVDKEMEKYVLGFIKMLLEHTRKLGVDLIIISHQTQQGLATKAIIFESYEYYLSFAANKNACLKFLESYFDLGKKEQRQLTNYRAKPFTFTCWRKSYPMYKVLGDTITLL